MRCHRCLTLVVAALLILAACSDDDGAPPTTAAATTQATAAPEPTTATTTPESTQATVGSTTTSPAEVPAANALAPFFEEAENLDTAIRMAADLFNESFDPDDGTVSAETTKVVFGLSAFPAAHLIPGGLDPDLEVAALAVVADLDSRIAALAGSIERLGDLDCLGFGAESAARFEGDLNRARALAENSPPVVVLAADSPEKGAVMVRATYIHGSNTCCDACGGYAYEQQIEIDWEDRILGPGFINTPFEATFDRGLWQVEFPDAG